MKMALGSSLSEENISISDYARGLAISDQRRYLEKISTCEVDPYCIPFAELSKDILPPVQCTDIFNYLVLGKSFCSSQRFKAFKSMEAYKYFECGFVNCLGTKIFSKNCVTVAKVSILMKVQKLRVLIVYRLDTLSVPMTHCS